MLAEQELSARGLPGYAVGGLAGGEDKSSFIRYALSQASIRGLRVLAHAWGNVELHEVSRTVWPAPFQAAWPCG